jgi:hypothetical protein
MNTRTGMLLAAAAAALATATAQARPVVADHERLTGYVPHRVLLRLDDAGGDSPEALYMGDVSHPLVMHLPQDQPQALLAPLEPANALTTNSGLYDLVSSGDDESMGGGPSLTASERFSMRRHSHGHGRVHVHLEDGGNSEGAVVTAVPLPGSLALLLAPLLALLATGAGLLRRPID